MFERMSSLVMLRNLSMFRYNLSDLPQIGNIRVCPSVKVGRYSILDVCSHSTIKTL